MIFKNTNIYSNLQIYCNYYNKNFDDCFSKLKEREREAILRGNISDKLVDRIGSYLKISEDKMNYMIKYDLSDDDCRWHFFCDYLDVYRRKMEDLELEITTRQFCLQNLLQGIEEEKYLKLINSLDIYEVGGINELQLYENKVKYQFETLDYVRVYLIITKNEEGINPECEIYIELPQLEDDILIFRNEPRCEIDVTGWDKYSVELWNEIMKLCPNNEYYFTISLKRLLNSAYQYSLREKLGLSIF